VERTRMVWKRREERERTPMALRSSSSESIMTQGWMLQKKLRRDAGQLSPDLPQAIAKTHKSNSS
jgi:hypothetical protein